MNKIAILFVNIVLLRDYFIDVNVSVVGLHINYRELLVVKWVEPIESLPKLYIN